MKIFIIILLYLIPFTVCSQHHSEHTEGDVEHGHGKHKIAFYSGFTHVSSAFYEHETEEESTGKWVPTLGLEYYYSLNHKWELGFIGDVELDKYYIRTGQDDELERNNVAVLSGVAKFKPTHRIGLFAGPGMEWEFTDHGSESFFVVKTGIEYEVAIENGWELTPIFSYDIKEEYSVFSFGISIGKRF